MVALGQTLHAVEEAEEGEQGEVSHAHDVAGCGPTCDLTEPAWARGVCSVGVSLFLILLACGADPVAETPVEAPVATLDSPFCPSFETCMEGLPTWGAPCERWYAGDPDCGPADWTESPAEKLAELRRGIAALRSPGRAPEPQEGDVKPFESAPADVAATKDAGPAKTARVTTRK